MKKLVTLSVACLIVLVFTASVMAFGGGWGKLCWKGCDPCCILESSQYQLPRGVWSETALIPPPSPEDPFPDGYPGNVLFAKGGKIWQLEGAALDLVEFTSDPNCYLTTYSGGIFTFQPPCCKDPLVDSEVSVFNYSCKLDCDTATFTVKFSGEFDDTGIFYEAIGHFTGHPTFGTTDEGNAVQGGRLDCVTLILSDPDGKLKDVCKRPGGKCRFKHDD